MLLKGYVTSAPRWRGKPDCARQRFSPFSFQHEKQLKVRKKKIKKMTTVPEDDDDDDVLYDVDAVDHDVPEVAGALASLAGDAIQLRVRKRKRSPTPEPTPKRTRTSPDPIALLQRLNAVQAERIAALAADVKRQKTAVKVLTRRNGTLRAQLDMRTDKLRRILRIMVEEEGGADAPLRTVSSPTPPPTRQRLVVKLSTRQKTAPKDAAPRMARLKKFHEWYTAAVLALGDKVHRSVYNVLADAGVEHSRFERCSIPLAEFARLLPEAYKMEEERYERKQLNLHQFVEVSRSALYDAFLANKPNASRHSVLETYRPLHNQGTKYDEWLLPARNWTNCWTWKPETRHTTNTAPKK